MTEERINRLEQRIAALEIQSTSLVSRVARLEPKLYAAPPIQQASAPPPKFDIPAPVVEGQVVPKKDAEYQIGAQWLPRIGAFLLILGIAYLIGLAVTKGWITPPMLFGGAVALCLGFIGVGFLLRDEREDFGQILMGIGSCGMFATIAGGHFYQSLYSGVEMLYGILGWSFLNLLYAFFRPSRAFLAIGVIGGMIAAVMPIKNHEFAASLGLNLVVLAMGSAVIVRHKFSFAALGLWLASAAAFLPIGFEDSVSMNLKVATVYGFTLLTLLAYLFGRRDSKPGEDATMVAVFGGVATLTAFGLQSGIQGTYHTLIAAAACGVLALVFRREAVVRNTFAYLALAIATLVSPFGLENPETVLLLSSLVVGTSIASIMLKRTHLATLALCQFVAAGAAYLLTFGNSGLVPPTNEPYLLAALLTASVSIAFSIGKDQTDPRLIVPFLAGWAIVSRLGLILFALPSDLRLASFSMTIAWVVFGCALLASGFIANLRNYRFAALTVLLAAVAKVLAIDMSTVTPELRVAALIGVGLALVGGGYAYVRKRGLVR